MFNFTTLMQPVVIEYIRTTLTPDQQVWLTKEIQKDPTGFINFLISPKGRSAAVEMLESYRAAATPGAAVIPAIAAPPVKAEIIPAVTAPVVDVMDDEPIVFLDEPKIEIAKKPKLVRVNGEWREVFEP